MKNTIIFDSKLSFKPEDTLTFFVNEDLVLNTEKNIFSASSLHKIQSFLKNSTLYKSYSQRY